MEVIIKQSTQHPCSHLSDKINLNIDDSETDLSKVSSRLLYNSYHKLSRSRVVYKFSCAGCSACYVGETNRHLITRVREHLSSDKNSHIFQHINGSEACRSLCSEDCFSILDTASTPFQLKIKEALHIAWEKPSLNKQVNHVNLTLSL